MQVQPNIIILHVIRLTLSVVALMELLLEVIFSAKYLEVWLLMKEINHAMLMDPEIYLKQLWDGDGRYI
jgi:hypothetical protein